MPSHKAASSQQNNTPKAIFGHCFLYVTICFTVVSYKIQLTFEFQLSLSFMKTLYMCGPQLYRRYTQQTFLNVENLPLLELRPEIMSIEERCGSSERVVRQEPFCGWN